MIDFRRTRLRSSPRFRLVPLDQVEERDRGTLEPLDKNPEFYGLLVPPSASALPLKSVSRDAALLFLTLRQPACVPHLLTSLFGANAEQRLRELVMDGIFEVEQAGGFVSGAASLGFFGGAGGEGPSSRVAQLSADAISYAAAIEGLSASETAARLYMYNRAPSTAHLQRQFADDRRLIDYLVHDTALAKQLESQWLCGISQESWLMWQTAEPATRCNFKLYISPTLDCLPHAFRVAVDTFVKVRCSHFKVGRTAFGLQRPDKFVAYFASLEQIQETAELIRASASGMFAQGVPFTAAIDADGLVSWGMDPPRFEQVLARQEHQSWRQWLTERIAIYTLAAKESGEENIMEFVLDRVSLNGIDRVTWSPNLAIWRGSSGSDEEMA